MACTERRSILHGTARELPGACMVSLALTKNGSCRKTSRQARLNSISLVNYFSVTPAMKLADHKITLPANVFLQVSSKGESSFRIDLMVLVKS